MTLYGKEVTESPPNKIEVFSVFGAPTAQSQILFRLKSEALNQFLESKVAGCRSTAIISVS